MGGAVGTQSSKSSSIWSSTSSSAGVGCEAGAGSCGTGAPIAAQQKALANKQAGLPVVVIATPGRLCDLLTRKSVDLSSVRYVVLDEVSHLVG